MDCLYRAFVAGIQKYRDAVYNGEKQFLEEIFANYGRLTIRKPSPKLPKAMRPSGFGYHTSLGRWPGLTIPHDEVGEE